ncbi:MAG: hypothetical protein HYV29_01580 [Ignavibacteriales bacterium]|nr:hypothetical protein [Ignavibacteriales bacterium]
MTHKELKIEFQKAGNRAIYINSALKTHHVLSGVKDLGQAWSLVPWIALRQGWNQCDVYVKFTGK